MAADPEFLEPTGVNPWDDPAFASDAQMAALLGLDSPIAPQPGEEIFIPDLENLLMPQPNAVNFGSSERSIAEVVYAFGYMAARLAHLRRLLDYSPSRDTDFDPFAPFCPPRMQEAVDAVRDAVRLQRGRIRINTMGGHVLNLVLAYGTAPDTRLFDIHNATGAGAIAMESIDAIHAEREAFERAMAEEARLLTTPAQETPDASGSTFSLNDAPAAKNETLTPRQILAAYEDGADGFDAATKKVDLSQLATALRLVAIQNVVAAHLDTLGELPVDAKLYNLEEAEQLLAALDKKRGVIELVGGITFNPRTEQYPVTGKKSLDVQLRAPGLTRNVVNAALAITAETQHSQASTLENTNPAEPALTEREAAGIAEQDTAEDTSRPGAPGYDAVRERFMDRLATALDGNLPDEETAREIYEAIASFDHMRDIKVVGTLFTCNARIGRTEAFDLIAALRREMPTWQAGRRMRPRQAPVRRDAVQTEPQLAARTGAQPRRRSSPHAAPQQRRSNR